MGRKEPPYVKERKKKLDKVTDVCSRQYPDCPAIPDKNLPECRTCPMVIATCHRKNSD